MSTGLIDVHSHLLPGVDDGCSSVEESVACAIALVEAGYTHAVCTPHVWLQYPENSVDGIPRRVAELQKQFDARALSLRLISGGEINITDAWPAMKTLPRNKIVTYAMAGQYVLFDFWSNTWPDSLTRSLRHLLDNGFVPVCAHPERVRVLQDLSNIDRLDNMGVKFQLNTWTLVEPPESIVRKMAERLLKEGRYFVFGTDTHKPDSMKPRTNGLLRARDLVGNEIVHQCTVTNPRTLIAPGEIQPGKFR